MNINDFNPEYSAVRGDGAVVMIEKTGGGTVGQSYDGLWSFVVWMQGTVIASGDDMYTGTPVTHNQAARLVFHWMGEGEL